MKHKHSFKRVLSTTGVALLISSCDQGHDFSDSLYGSFAENPSSKGISLLDINNSNLSEDFFAKIQCVNSIVENLLSNKNEVELFARDPSSYLVSKQLHFKITLSESEKNMLLAFSDEKVIEAVKENDIETFLRICNDNGYIGVFDSDTTNNNVRSMFKTDEDYDDFMSMICTKGNGEISSRVVGVLAIPVAVVAYMYLGAVTMAGVGLGAAVYAGVELWGPSVSGESTTRSYEEINFKEPVIKIWTDNNGQIKSDVFYSEVIDRQIHSVSELLEKEFPSMDVDQACEILRIQLEGYYGLRQ